MYCKKCGFTLKETDSKCPFCNNPIDKNEEKPQYEEYQNVFNKENSNVMYNIRNANGYVNLKTSWWHHILIAAGGYLLMNVLVNVVAVILIVLFKANGYDFSCINTDVSSCPTGVYETYIKISAGSQMACELLVVGAVALIFMKSIKHLFKGAKEKKTWKWYGLGMAMMYGTNMIYSYFLMFLEMFGIKPEVNANQSAVNEIIFGSPLLGFVFVVIAAPLFEEIIFRFGVYRAFTGKGKKLEFVGLIVTTILFAGIHMVSTFTSAITASGIDWKLIGNDMLSLPSYLIGAFFLTFGYYKSKNLLTPILMHMTWNFISFVANLLI